MKWIIFASILLASGFSQAQAPRDIYRLFPVLSCPAVGNEYEKMISKLDAIKTSIKSDANCQNVALKVKSLEDLVVKDRQKVLELTQQEKIENLTAEQAQLVRDYAENVTKKVSSLMDLFMNSNYCFREEGPDKQLSQLAGFVNEASQLVGALSGPWGTPIALAGNVVAGFLTGMDQVLKSRSGYDFNQRDQWMNYVENLCTYHSYRDQIEHLLNPRARVAELQDLKAKLEGHLQDMAQQCRECQNIQDAYNAQRKTPAKQLSEQLSPQIKAADSTFAQPLGSYTLQSLGLRDWVNEEIKRVQREAASYWSDASGRHMLTRAKEQIENFLVDRESVRFLSHQVARSQKDFNNFLYFVGSEGTSLYVRLNNSGYGIISSPLNNAVWSSPVEVFRSLIVKPLDWEKMPQSSHREDMKFSWNHFHHQSMARLRKVQTTLQVAQSFCSFFKHSGQYNSGIRAQCSSNHLRRLLEQGSNLEKEIADSEGDSESLLLNPELVNNDAALKVYSRNKIEALSRAIEFRSHKP